MNKQTEGSVLRYACDKLVSVNAKSALTAGQTILAWGLCSQLSTVGLNFGFTKRKFKVSNFSSSGAMASTYPDCLPFNKTPSVPVIAIWSC
jgi:hypothetical protein